MTTGTMTNITTPSSYARHVYTAQQDRRDRRSDLAACRSTVPLVAMALRDFVTGSDMCTPDEGAGPSNAAATFANSLLGRSAKEQERLREVRVTGKAQVR